ncbi:MAG: YicC/YloC family endoribonuclease [Candidatus Aminicenantales bacterium]
MIQSMTGFAEKRSHSKKVSTRVVVKSLNHRYFDWNYNGPQLASLENRLRTICQKEIQRGRVDVFLELSFFDNSEWNVYIDEGLLEKLISVFEKTASRLGKNIHFSLESLVRIPGLVTVERRELSASEMAFIERAFRNALREMISQRKREGRELAKAIRSHQECIKEALGRIEPLARKQPLFLREKLRQRLEELAGDKQLTEEKLAEEASYYAQRYDLSEEIARIKTHLLHLAQLLSPRKKEPVGKNLDFIAQEIYREANTLASKSQDIEIISQSLRIKAEVESIRQQVQNIE